MKKKELLISKEGDNINIALIEDDRLIEVHNEKINNNISVGDIFIGKVRKLLPSLNAAFIDIGSAKDSFLHYNDLGGRFKTMDKYCRDLRNGVRKTHLLNDIKNEPELAKEGFISDVLSNTQNILVQITKEPISTKGPRLSSDISIAGRFLILIPFSDKISVSHKIEEEIEKKRLTKLIAKIKPKGFGVIIRTVAENKEVKELENDLTELIVKWKEIYKNIKTKVSQSRVLSEMDRASTILRDLFDNNFKSIEVDDLELFTDIKNYIKNISPISEGVVKYYQHKNLPLFEKYGVEKQFKLSFGKVVHMVKGSYLIIEHTEAMHVIDVNSGNKATTSEDQEENSMAVNLIAAKEIARQLRLRDMGGIIVIDFIDLKKSENRKILYDKFCEFMKDDRAKHRILQPSKFGLIQLTRQRVRPARNIQTKEDNPNKDGLVEAPITLINKIESEVSILTTEGKKELFIHVHPFVASYLTKKEGLLSRSIKGKWESTYKAKINIVARDKYRYLEVNILNKDGEKLVVEINEKEYLD